jgi:cytochrome c551/c552
MPSPLKVVCVALALLASGAVFGQTSCVNCHDAERRKVGPSMREIGAKYKGDKAKAGEIVARMKEGKGHPKLAGSDAELKAAVEAALSTK